MTRRNQRLDHLMTPRQQARLRKLWRDFQAAVDENFDHDDPVQRKLHARKIEKLRREMPPGGASWPLWSVVLAEPVEVDAQNVVTSGNARVAAARELGIDEIAVERV